MVRVSRLSAAGLSLLAIFGLSGALAAGDRLTVVNPDSAYPEGPMVRDGILYYTEMGSDRVMAWDGKTNRVVWSRPNCLPTTVAAWRQDELIVLCHREALLARVSLDGETLGLIEADDEGQGFPTPNAATSDARGGLYFSSSGSFRAERAGEGVGALSRP